MIITKDLTPMKAIRKKCLECCCGQQNEVTLCHIKDCALWSYRMGHRPEVMPTYEVEISERQLEHLERMRANRPATKSLEGVDAETNT